MPDTLYRLTRERAYPELKPFTPGALAATLVIRGEVRTPPDGRSYVWTIDAEDVAKPRSRQRGGFRYIAELVEA